MRNELTARAKRITTARQALEDSINNVELLAGQLRLIGEEANSGELTASKNSILKELDFMSEELSYCALDLAAEVAKQSPLEAHELEEDVPAVRQAKEILKEASDVSDTSRNDS